MNIKPLYSIKPQDWEITLEEQKWLEEIAEALKPFIEAADKIPYVREDQLGLTYDGRITIEQWLMLKKIVTGTTDIKRFR